MRVVRKQLYNWNCAKTHQCDKLVRVDFCSKPAHASYSLCKLLLCYCRSASNTRNSLYSEANTAPAVCGVVSHHICKPTALPHTAQPLTTAQRLGYSVWYSQGLRNGDQSVNGDGAYDGGLVAGSGRRDRKKIYRALRQASQSLLAGTPTLVAKNH